MRLIDADRFEAFCTGIPDWADADSFMQGIDEVIYEIDNAPTVNAVEVVRCKDCRYYEIMQLKRDGTDDRRYKPSLCVLHNRNFDEDYFCADGERREDGTADK